MARFVGKSFECHRRDGILCVCHLSQLSGKPALAAPDFKDGLPGQEMNQMPERLSAPPEPILRDRIPLRKILIPRLLTNGKSLERRMDCISHYCPFLT